ncbi:MAG: transcriptional regulator [Candidatus Pacebacteria bacterium CG_4_10_14_3_um_filter_34_15]|nr:MAG: transcriptional regulator [Candidatus Pacebacteria bacterium CG11_big_fil_rev_8_21_14_0_20_34_55]PIX81564.1 MAG: transcriptional regulator [Candidatus Pacebacteria bacterium CG_4_10_14_3_um_filter_34_15]PJC43951.1 MAG: transcriptional regulator [Candidatus Pacebacteria bacterium CG_4_9_14_0_2_um_filter_34_50]
MNMKNNNVSLKEWGKQFSLSQKKNAKKANNYYVVVEEFKKIRKELGFTQQELADKMGIDRTVITKIETGARNTTLNSLIKFAEGMDKKLKISFV